MITNAEAWTNNVFIDLEIEHNGKDYYWQGTLDGKLSTWQIREDDEDVEDEDLFNKIQTIAFEYLENIHRDAAGNVLNGGRNKLDELLNNVYYEG